LALPPHAAGLAPVDVGLLGVAHLADCCAAANVDAADLTGRHTHGGVGALLAQQLDAGAGRAGQLGAAAGPQLDRVDHGAGRYVAQRQVVAGLDVGIGTGLNHITLRQALRRNDVALLAVEVVQQRDVGGAIRVVLDVRDLGVDAVLVVATEVDHAVRPLVATALVPGGDPTVRVASALAVQRTNQRLLRMVASDLREIGDAGTATTRGRRLVLANSHDSLGLSALFAGYAGAPNRSIGLLPAANVT